MGWTVTVVLGVIGLFFLCINYGALIASKKNGKHISGVPFIGGICIFLAFVFSPIKWLSLLCFLDYSLILFILELLGIRKKENQEIEVKHIYNPEIEKPVIRASVCNGEKTAGFKNIKTGEFYEVAVIRNDVDLQQFKDMYKIKDIETDYNI